MDDLFFQRAPTAERPLLGLTVLVVEDSRFASEAIRLMCLRSGARIRRADSLAAAGRHLQVYRPNAIIVDLGLPDGLGTTLIAQLAHNAPRIPVILGTSGDAGAEAEAKAAGADGFLMKPLGSLAAFQQAVLDHMPQELQPKGPRSLPKGRVDPDPVALRDDLAHVADVLTAETDNPTGGDGLGLDYVAQFLSSLAYAAEDKPLALAAATLASSRNSVEDQARAVADITELVEVRLSGSSPI